MNIPSCILAGGLLLIACCEVAVVSARQLHESCDEINKCDTSKNLYCSYGDSGESTGICVAKPGRSCHFDGKVYLNGETFFPNCKFQCICIDADVGCTPQCPLKLTVPKGCAHPKLVLRPGKCCSEWICPANKYKYHLKTKNTLNANDVLRESSNDRFESKRLELSARRIPAISILSRKQDNCMVRTTEWSECSEKCGWGVSERFTNNNKACRLRKETRLCQIRPCNSESTSTMKRGKKCMRTTKAKTPVRYSFSGCKSKIYKPTYCGQCTDGRCCSPALTKTISVTFHCDDGFSFKKQMMSIKTCACQSQCSESGKNLFEELIATDKDMQQRSN